MNRSQTNLLVFVVFAVRYLQAAPTDDLLVRDPGMLAGPWEAKSDDNLVGTALRTGLALFVVFRNLPLMKQAALNLLAGFAAMVS